MTRWNISNIFFLECPGNDATSRSSQESSTSSPAPLGRQVDADQGRSTIAWGRVSASCRRMCGGAASQLASNGRQVSRRSWSAGSFHRSSGHQHPHVHCVRAEFAVTSDGGRIRGRDHCGCRQGLRRAGVRDRRPARRVGCVGQRARARHYSARYGIHVRDEGGHLQRIGAAPRPGEGGQGP